MSSKPAAQAAEAAPPKKSKKLLIIIVAALLILVGGGAGVYMMIQKNAAQHEAEASAEGDAESSAEEGDKKPKHGKKKKGEKEAPPVYVTMEPFTVNLQAEEGDQFLQLTIALETEDNHTAEHVRLYTPKLRNKIMLLLSGHKASELMDKESKQALAEEIGTQVNELLGESGDAKLPEKMVKEVLFTSFIIQ
ncbi:MAG: flagellar basal body-associated FliL family protein [Pseudomonadota bacterium]